MIFCQFWLFFVFKLLLSFFLLCEEVQCVYLCLHLGFTSSLEISYLVFSCALELGFVTSRHIFSGLYHLEGAFTLTKVDLNDSGLDWGLRCLLVRLYQISGEYVIRGPSP